MKLKKLFLANAILILFISCSSNKALPIPGQSDIAITNIYAEYLNIADIYFDLEKYDKATTYYKAAMSNQDIYWTAYYKLAKCYAVQSKWEEAEKSYEDILKRDPENNTIKSSIAYIYAMNGNTDKALSVYEKLIQENPDEVSYLENYISILITAEKTDEAKNYYNQLIEKFPENKNNENFTKYFDSIKTEETEPEEKSDSVEEA